MCRRMQEVPAVRVRATPLARASIWVIGVYGVVQGSAIIGVDVARFSGPSYLVLKDFPGAPASWGLSAIAFGTMILLGSVTRHWWVKAAGLLCMSSWALVFGAGALGAVFITPNAGTTGAPTYALVAVLTAILIWVDEGDHDSQVADKPLD